MKSSPDREFSFLLEEVYAGTGMGEKVYRLNYAPPIEKPECIGFTKAFVGDM